MKVHKSFYINLNKKIRNILHPEINTICLSFIIGALIYYLNWGVLAVLIIVKLNNRLFLVVLFTIIGFLYSYNYELKINTETQLIQNTSIETIGEVVEEPRINSYNQEAIVKVDNITGYIAINIPKYPTFKLGDKVRIKGLVEEIKSEDNSNFNKKSFYNSRKIFYEIKKGEIKNLNEQSLIYKIRRDIENTINKNIPEPEASILNGILTGNDNNMSKEFKDKFTTAGLSHITSVSGYNFTVIYLLLQKLSGGLGKIITTVISMVLIISFLSLVGTTNLPALRATIMILLLCTSSLVGRKANLSTIIIVTILVILIEYPKFYTNISLFLSISSLSGLIILTPIIKQFLERTKLSKFIIENLSTSIAATISTAPISIIIFNQISIWGVINSLVVLPLIPVITLFSILILLATNFLPEVMNTTFYFINFKLLGIITKIANLY